MGFQNDLMTTKKWFTFYWTTLYVTRVLAKYKAFQISDRRTCHTSVSGSRWRRFLFWKWEYSTVSISP